MSSSDADAGFLDKCSQVLQTRLDTLFGSLGGKVGRSPWWTIVISIGVVLVSMAGFANWTTESRTEKLWVPQDSRAIEEQDWVRDTFGDRTRPGEILMKPTDGGNALTASHVQQYWQAHQELLGASDEAEANTDQFPDVYSWDGSVAGSVGVCLKAGASACEMATILDVVGYDEASVMALTDASLLGLVNNPGNWVSLTGNFIVMTNVLGGIEYEADGTTVKSAKVLRGSYTIESASILVNKQYEDPSREAWELAAEEAITGRDYPGLKTIAFFNAFFSEEFSGAISGDLNLFIMGYCLLMFYAIIALGKRDYVYSMIGVAGGAILTVGLSLGGSFGLAGAFGVLYTPLSSSLPFLILGLGIDDAFIIAGEFQQQAKEKPTASPAALMEATMRHAGVSILITSVTDVLAFSIGATTILPALAAYCLFAAFGVLYVFFLNVTFFAAVVVIDAKRAQANRADCCCCFTLKTPHEMHVDKEEDKLPYCLCCHKLPNDASRKMFHALGLQLLNPYVKASILLLTMALAGVCCYGASQLKQDFQLQWFLPDSSSLQEYYDWKDEYFSVGLPVSVYTREIDYFATRTEITEAGDVLDSADYLLTRLTRDWHDAFWSWAESNRSTLAGAVTAGNYYDSLFTYLNNTDEGDAFLNYVAWVDEADVSQGIAGAQLFAFYTEEAVVDADAQVDAMDWIRDDIGAIAGEQTMFPFAFSMIFWEQYAVIEAELWRNLSMTAGVVFVITMILIPKVSAALLVLVCVVLTMVDLLGFMWMWDLTIDGVTMTYLVIAIGLAVDYSAHVGEAFMLSTAGTRDERAVDALTRMGASVFNGAFSTLLAVLAMSLAETYIFRVFFRQFFLVTVLGAFHGLVVLPILLTLLGPSTTLTHDAFEQGKGKEGSTTGDNKDTLQMGAAKAIPRDSAMIERPINVAGTPGSKDSDSK